MHTLNKSDLVALLSEQLPDLPARTVKKATNALLRTMRDGLSSGRRVDIRRFGVFTLRFRPARTTRDPRNGEFVRTPDRYAPWFRASLILNRKINEPAQPPLEGDACRRHSSVARQDTARFARHETGQERSTRGSGRS